jgi:hypothetical protein
LLIGLILRICNPGYMKKSPTIDYIVKNILNLESCVQSRQQLDLSRMSDSDYTEE